MVRGFLGKTYYYMKQVTKDVFYNTIGDLDAIVTIENALRPYTAVFKLRYGKVLGQVIESDDPVESAIGEGKTYFLAN